MSRVFVAREKALGRRVVLKVLPPDVAASVSSDRFQREIQVAARLQHPHIVPLLSAGRAAAQLIAAHATERPVPVRDRRRAVPVALGDTIMELLEKRPADRPQSADELLSVLEVSHAASDPVSTTRGVSTSVSRGPISTAPWRGRWLVVGGIVAMVLGLSVAWLTRRQSATKVDKGVVAVAPFRVSGADSSLGYLREGMVDLLAAKLSGVSGIRAADPRSSLAAWRRKAGTAGDLTEQDAIEVAGRIGAGRLIEG